MALIKCYECGHDVSTRASNCPHCGSPVNKIEKEEKREHDKKEEKIESNKNICSNCGKENKPDASFCVGCGNTLVNGNIKCKKCGHKNKNGTLYCENCGSKLINSVNNFCPNCGYKNNKEAKFCNRCGRKMNCSTWNFDSLTLTIFFLLTFFCGTLLFSSSEFRRVINADDIFFFNNNFLGVITLSLGLIVLIHMFIKDGFSLENDLAHLKRFRLSKFHVALLFLISTIFLFGSLGFLSRESTIEIFSLILFVSFFGSCSTAIYLNWSKLGWIQEGFTLLLSIGFFIASFACFMHGNELNNSFEHQARSLFEHGRTNPGNDYFTYGIITLIIAIVFLLCFILMLRKGKKHE